MTSDDHNPSRAPPMPQHPRRSAGPPPPAMKDAKKDAGKDAGNGERAGDLDLAIDEIAPTRNLKEGFTGQER